MEFMSQRIGVLRNKVECLAGLDKSEVIDYSHNFYETRLSTKVKTIESSIILRSNRMWPRDLEFSEEQRVRKKTRRRGT